MNKAPQSLAGKIRLAIFDVDGVLTDGRLYLLPNGEELKVFDARDGLGLKMLQKSGVEVAIISGRKSTVVTERFQKLGIKHIYQGHEDKLPVFEKILDMTNIQAGQTLFMGDDILDIPVIVAAGMGCAVADAHPKAINAADHVTRNPGGRGAAREICDLVLAARASAGN